MNIRQKFTVAALLTSFVLASNPAKADVLGFSVALPDLGVRDGRGRQAWSPPTWRATCAMR